MLPEIDCKFNFELNSQWQLTYIKILKKKEEKKDTSLLNEFLPISHES